MELLEMDDLTSLQHGLELDKIDPITVIEERWVL
jgi:hypothetical protein